MNMKQNGLTIKFSNQISFHIADRENETNDEIEEEEKKANIFLKRILLFVEYCMKSHNF